MTAWIGALLVAGGCTAAGVQAALRLRGRVRLLEAWLSAVRLLINEISFGRASLPELLAKTGENIPQLADFMSALAGSWVPWAGKRLEQLWREEAASLELSGPDRALVAEIGGVLGRYDAERQADSLEYLYRRLEAALAAAREAQTRHGRLYAALGAALGLAVIILTV